MTPRAGTEFEQSAAYVSSPDAVAVSGACVLTAYAQIHMLELIARGVERREASRVGWAVLHALIRATGLWACADVDSAERGQVNCLAMTSQAVMEALRLPLDEFRRRHDVIAPMALLHPDDRDRAVWQLDAVRLVAHGVDLPNAIRQASDAAAGKPRQRRAPATPDVVITELQTCLRSLWWSLCHASKPPYGRLWLVEVLPKDERPVGDGLVRPAQPADPSDVVGPTEGGGGPHPQHS